MMEEEEEEEGARRVGRLWYPPWHNT